MLTERDMLGREEGRAEVESEEGGAEEGGGRSGGVAPCPGEDDVEDCISSPRVTREMGLQERRKAKR